MEDRLKQRLEALRIDHTRLTGRPFTHFLCPITFVDSPGALCEGHIINRQFPNSSRAWTVQRTDIDGFYGTHFEAEFVLLRYPRNISAAEVMADHKLRGLVRPRILVGEEPIEHFSSKSRTLPETFTPVVLTEGDRIAGTVLKLPLETIRAAAEQKWEIDFRKDLRLPALVSVLKAAHLTLFEMLGYGYALSGPGQFLGAEILGDFYQHNCDSSPSHTRAGAKRFFRRYQHLVLPVDSTAEELRGTITDGRVFACLHEDGIPWALQVFVRTGNAQWAVMVPASDESLPEFRNRLETGDEVPLVGRMWTFDKARGWISSTQVYRFAWPKQFIIDPEE